MLTGNIALWCIFRVLGNCIIVKFCENYMPCVYGNKLDGVTCNCSFSPGVTVFMQKTIESHKGTKVGLNKY